MKKIKIYFAALIAVFNEIWMIFNSYRSDHPEHFWLNPVTLSSGRYVYADGTCESFIAPEYFSQKKICPPRRKKSMPPQMSCLKE